MSTQLDKIVIYLLLFLIRNDFEMENESKKCIHLNLTFPSVHCPTNSAAKGLQLRTLRLHQELLPPSLNNLSQEQLHIHQKEVREIAEGKRCVWLEQSRWGYRGDSRRSGREMPGESTGRPWEGEKGGQPNSLRATTAAIRHITYF